MKMPGICLLLRVRRDMLFGSCVCGGICLHNPLDAVERPCAPVLQLVSDVAPS